MRGQLAEQVRAFRKSAGKTQSEFANDIGFSEHYIYLIERGQCVPMKVSTLVRLSNAIGVPLDNVISSVVQDRTKNLNENLRKK